MDFFILVAFTSSRILDLVFFTMNSIVKSDTRFEAKDSLVPNPIKLIGVCTMNVDMFSSDQGNLTSKFSDLFEKNNNKNIIVYFKINKEFDFV